MPDFARANSQYAEGWPAEPARATRTTFSIVVGGAPSTLPIGRVFGLAADELDRLLAEDEAEDRRMFEQMFAAAYVSQPSDAEDD